jgi:predicted dehydrogenase
VIDTIGWGILGPGTIATKFATDLQNLPDARLVAVGSRAQERAESFASQFDIDSAYGSYEALVEDPAVDVVYVATPHPYHREHTLLCLRHGKAVLCEKPLGVSERDVRAMILQARKENLFMMEAMWTRFLPVWETVRGWLSERRIGDVRQVQCDFGFRTAWNPEGRLLNPDMAGGALLDVGVYCVAVALMVYGGAPLQVQATAHLGETGVDEQTAMLLAYRDGAMAMLSCAIRTATPQTAFLIGTEGIITVPDFWHATEAMLERDDQEPVIARGKVGYHFEAREVMECLRQGHTESDVMPWQDSVHIARTMDRVRSAIGLEYPWE